MTLPNSAITSERVAQHQLRFKHHTYLVDLVLPNATTCTGLGFSGETPAQAPVVAYTIDTSHEFAEAATNPTGIGWTDASGYEIADLCDLADSPFPPDMTVATAGLWSNQQHGCIPWWPNAMTPSGT